MPESEVAAQAALFAAHGFDPTHVVKDRGDGYFDFVKAIATKAHLKQCIEKDPGIIEREAAFSKEFNTWWKKHSPTIAALPQ